MDEMTAFDQQIAREVVREAGPPESVDGAAIFTAITATQSPKWRFQSMFSATRFVVAGAIVALFGGFLLAGVLTTQPSDEAMPAAVTDSPAPATPDGLLPGVDLVTDEVEPGVYRVLSDGTGNDLAIHATVNGDGDAQVIAGQDGSVWIRDRQLEGEDRLLRLGIADVYDASRLHDYWPDISVDPDGTLWALGESATAGGSGNADGQLLSLTDGEWTAHAVPDDSLLMGIETPADGSVWASMRSWNGEGCPDADEQGDVGGARLAVARLVEGEWVEEAIELGPPARGRGSFAVGPDDTALLGATHFNSCRDGAWIGVMERTDDGWAPFVTSEPAADGPYHGTGPVAIGADGTAWAYQSTSLIGKGLPTWSPRLLRRTQGDWEVLGDDESVPALSVSQGWDSRMTVSPDGRLWIALDGPGVIDHHRVWDDRSIAATLDGLCAGVLSYDGTSWSHHLPGACVSDISAAANSDVWATVLDIDPAWIDDLLPDAREAATTLPSPPAGLYVITPEAVAE